MRHPGPPRCRSGGGTTDRGHRLARLAGPGLVALLVVAGCRGAPPPIPQIPPGPIAGPSLATPPGATLEIPNGTRVHGELGSYTYLGTGSDSPWLPADALDPVAVGIGRRITIRLEGDRPATAGRAMIAPAADRQGTRARTVPLAGPQPDGGFDMTGPAPGSWVLLVELVYPEGSGSGAYYWRLDVR